MEGATQKKSPNFSARISGATPSAWAASPKERVLGTALACSSVQSPFSMRILRVAETRNQPIDAHSIVDLLASEPRWNGRR